MLKSSRHAALRTNMTVVTRFAPSPTGFLHIGGARTALFNWLLARHAGGQYLLRIEDTDRQRSTNDAINAILDGLSWLGLDHDGEVVYQSANQARHAALADELLTRGAAYRCYCSAEELAEMREEARAAGRRRLYDGRWRDRDPSEAPSGIDPVVRIKMPLTGKTVLVDDVQGEIEVDNEQLDDFVLLRADGTPTYMLAVVADDHDMGITHIIRGDDHLNNAFRQYHLFRACGWEAPSIAHIPLIHGPDGGKLSKRHGALGLEAYREMGYLPEGLRNYLLRLGWSHGDEEIISTKQAVDWFDLRSVGRSPARIDFAKMANVNAHYLREADNECLISLVLPFISQKLGVPPDAAAVDRVRRGLDGLKPRASTLDELAEGALFYCRTTPLPMTEKAAKLLDDEGRARIRALAERLADSNTWDEEKFEHAVRTFAESEGVKLGKVAQPLRAALTGSTSSPGIFEVMAALGRDEVIARIAAVGG